MNQPSHDDFSRSPVVDSNFRPWWYLLIIEMGVMISIPIFMLGGQLGLGLTLHDLVLSTFCGAAVLGVIGGLTARLGAITRCSTALIARITFGRHGSSCIALLLAMAMIGWWGVQTEMFANAVKELAQRLFHISLPGWAMIAVGGSAMITTAALGIRAIGRLSYVAVPLLVMGLVYALASLFGSGNQNLLTHYQPGSHALNFGAAEATVAGGFIVGASMNPDYSRFALTKRHALAYALTDYMVAYPLLLIASGVVAISFQDSNIMVHLVPAGYSWLVFLMMMFATWAANDCNLYSSSLSLAAVLPNLQRSHLAVIAGICGIILAEFHIAGHMITFLTLLGIMIAPISGVLIVNAFGRRHPVAPAELEQVPDWRHGQLLAWLCGATVGYVATPKDALGMGLIQLTTLPTLDSVIAASVAMLLVKFVQKIASPIQSTEAAPSSQYVYAETEWDR